MELQWTSKALSDLARLHEFLASLDKSAAARTIQSLIAAPAGLLENPRIRASARGLMSSRRARCAGFSPGAMKYVTRL